MRESTAMSEKIDTELLYEYLLDREMPVVETDLLRAFFPESAAVLSGGVSLELFRYHFRLYHALYRLEQKLLHSDYLLCIKHIWIYLLKLPGGGKCRYFDEESVQFCRGSVKTGSSFCAIHTYKEEKLKNAGVIGSQHIRAFYLDMSNIETITEENLHKMQQGLLHYLFSYKEIEDALRIMGLPRDFSLQKLKARYRYLSKKHHPDTSRGCERSFKEITRSYAALLRFKERMAENTS